MYSGQQHFYHATNVSTISFRLLKTHKRLSDNFPQLKALIESRHPKSNKGRMIMLGMIVLAGFVAAASPSGSYTLPFMILVVVVVFFFKRFERFFSGSEQAWRNFLDNTQGTSLETHLPIIEQELTGETIEWSDVMITDSYLLWPRQLEQLKLAPLAEITRVYLSSEDPVQLRCDGPTLGEHSVLTSIEAEISEIVNEIMNRYPDLEIDASLLPLLVSDQEDAGEADES